MSRANAYGRERPNRAPAKTMLIVTEGSKTEPIYFQGLARANRLSSARIKVSQGTNPLSVVECASREKKAAEAAAKSGDGTRYDRVWAVFDTEEHMLGSTELVAATQLAIQNAISLAVTAPCFEYWILLHFQYTTCYMRNYAEIVPLLAKHIPGYSKSAPPIDLLIGSTDIAIAHAIKLRNHNALCGANLPDTQVHELVQELLKSRQ